MAGRELFGLEDQGSTTYPFPLIRDHSFGVEGDQAISGWAATNRKIGSGARFEGRYQGPIKGFDSGYNYRWKG